MSVSLLEKDADLAPLAAIHAASFVDAWNAHAIADMLAMPGTFGFSGDNGFVLVRAAGGEAEILTLAVAPAARRRGTAHTLVTAAASHAHLQGATVMFLEVGAGNASAITLYARLGFAEVGRRKGYYTANPSKPEDALVLRGNLPLSPLGKNTAAS